MAESYKDLLGFTWKKEGDKYVQYRGDGSKTGKTKPYKVTSGGAKNKKTNKTVNKDPRPTWSSKKYKNYGEFRQAVLAWKKRNEKPKEKRKYVSPYERKHGKKPKTSNDLKVKKEPYAKDRVGSVDLNSKEYKEAKSINERKVEYQTNKKNVSKENKKDNQNNEEKVVNNNKLKIKSTTKGGPVKSGVEYAKSKGDDLAGYRRTKDTRITKKLKKAGFTEDRLARLRKEHAEWKANRKKKKNKKK